MRVLIANDDGIDAPGIRMLAEVMGREHEIYVCAPSGERSSFSHSVTYWRLKNKAWKREVPGAAAAWAVDATPADCIYYGIHAFMKEMPDAVVTGINRGENLSTDCIYSGTVGAAMEGMLTGIPSMAVSLCSYTASCEEDYRVSAETALRLLPMLMREKGKDRFMLNVNVPSLSREKIRGIRVTSFDGIKDYQKRIVTEKQPDGSLLLECPNQPAGVRDARNEPDADITAVRKGYVSVTPLYADMVDYRAVKELSDWNTKELF